MNPDQTPTPPSQPSNMMPSQDDMELDTPAARPPQFAKKAVQRKKRIFIIVGVVLAVVLLAGGAYWFFVMNKKDAKTDTTSQDLKNSNSLCAGDPNAEGCGEEETGNTEPDSTLTAYKSSKLNIEFSHRKDWKVREFADRSEVVLTSPKVAYTKTDGTAAEGVFTLRMRTGTIPEAMQNTVVKSIAVRDSEIVAYDAPTEQQRQYTNITDAGVDANTFNLVIVSSSTSFKAGQAIGYGVNLTGDAYMFAGGYGTDAGNTLTFDGVPKAEFTTPAYEQAVAIIKSLKIF